MSTIDRLQRVLNATARVISGTRKFDPGLTQLRQSELHWLDVPVNIHRYLESRAPQNLVDCCSVSQKILPLRFSEFFPKRLRIFDRNSTRLLHVHICARLQHFI